MFVPASKNGFSVKAYRGDAKTLLAFDLLKSKSKNLAGFTIACKPDGKKEYYLYNKLQFENPKEHAQDINEPAYSSINAPIQKYRWLHVIGQFHQGLNPHLGKYKYSSTPRYFKDGKMLPLDSSLTVSVSIEVAPYSQKNIDTGFTRGFVQSQAFVNHFGNKALFKPKAKQLLFDTSKSAGKNNKGKSFSFLDEYDWSGYTAREKVFAMVNEVINDKDLSLDVFAYDLNEPDILKFFLRLAKEGRIRIILDNASLHHTKTNTKDEDLFEIEFDKKAKAPAELKRGRFGRYAHDKIFIVSKKQTPVKVLTGSTNFSVTGLYINSNHVLVFNNKELAKLYSDVFNEAWTENVSSKFNQSKFANKLFSFKANGLPKMNISFSPHQAAFASSNLKKIAQRIKAEKKNVFFAVMGISQGGGDVLPALRKIHSNQKIFSYGISDSPGGISLYRPGRKNGLLVTGKASAELPPPFDKEQSIGNAHQIHHKFVICGFNGNNPVVWCGSSNLAAGGEAANGDNLIAIYDDDLVTVFTLEAVGLVDHFHFRDKFVLTTKTKKPKPMILNSDDSWVPRYYDPDDLYYKDRQLFG